MAQVFICNVPTSVTTGGLVTCPPAQFESISIDQLGTEIAKSHPFFPELNEADVSTIMGATLLYLILCYKGKHIVRILTITTND